MKHKEQGICKPILAIITLKNSDNKITSKSTSIAIKSQGNMFFLALFLFKFKITCGMLIWNLMSVCPSGLQSWTQLSPTISNIKALGTEALTMSLNPFCTCLFTVFHYTFISELLSLGASTADLLLWFWLRTRFCDFQALVRLWSRQSQGRGSILQRQSTHRHKSFKNSRCRNEWC